MALGRMDFEGLSAGHQLDGVQDDPVLTDRESSGNLCCLVPLDLGEKAAERLHNHFADDPQIKVVVEHRSHDRRSGVERRVRNVRHTPDRRKVRSTTGRRAGERRASLVPAAVPELPRGLRRYATGVSFVERVEPPPLHRADVEAQREVVRFQSGDGKAFAALYHRYIDSVYSYLRLALEDYHEAEDAAQHVFLQLFHALPRYERRQGKPFRAWLFRIAKNHALNRMRDQARFDVEDPAELDRLLELREDRPAPELLGWISDKDLLFLLGRLSPPQRQVIVLRFMLDLSTAEVAEILGKKPGAVRKLQHQGLAFLRERLTALGHGPDSKQRPCRARHRPIQARVLRERRFALLRY